MFASPIEAYASVEHSAIRGMYVDPDRLDRSLERSIKIIQIKVCKNLPLKFPQKWRRIRRKLPQSYVKMPPIMRYDLFSCVSNGHGGLALHLELQLKSVSTTTNF